MSRYHWELEAVIEGKLLERVDQRENLAELAAKLRYTIHSEKVQPKKLFDKKSEEKQVKEIFNRSNEKGQPEKSLAERIRYVNEYFRKKGARDE